MSLQLITELPLWFIIFCVMLGAAYAWVLYYKDTTLTDAPPWLRWLLAGLRFVVASVLAILLLSPLIKTTSRETEKPIVVIAQDNSQSIVFSRDSAYYKGAYNEQLNKLSEALAEVYDVRTFSFGDKVEEGFTNSYSGKQTDFSGLFDELNARFTNRNIGAVIVASDGLYNHGSNPQYAPGALKVPVFAIALGDTTVQKDVILAGIRYNETVYFGNNFPVQLQINARKCAGAATLLTVRKNGTVVMSRNIEISNNNFSLNLPLFFEAKEKGIVKYSFSLAAVDGEISTINNSKEIYIQVLEGKRKVLLLAHSPHPDLAAIRNAIEKSDGYDITVSQVSRFDGKLEGYNLVILHQLPSRNNKITSLLQQSQQQGIPLLFILGNQSSLADFNAAGAGITIGDNRNITNDAQPALSADFSLFTLSENLTRFIPRMPPLVAPFGTYQFGASGGILFYQQIGAVRANQPLVYFATEPGRRTGVVAGEGMWRWRLADYAENNNHDASDEVILKMVQYLSVKEEKTRFRIIAKNNYKENEPLQLFAEVYNQTYELVNEPEVSITITNEQKTAYPFTFSRTDKAYSLNAGLFPPGDYSYSAVARFADTPLTTTGRFTVSAIQVETNETVADHQVLYAMAQKYGGTMVYPNDMLQLKDSLLNREDIRPVTYLQSKLEDFINLKWIFFLLLGLITIEWFLRKRSGSY